MTLLDEIDTIEIGIPGPSGAGLTAAEKAAILADIAALYAALGVVVQDEGTPLATRGTTVNFVGAGVAASGTGAVKTVTIPGGTSTIVVQQNDLAVSSVVTTVDVTSPLTATESPAGEANIGHGNHNPAIFAQATKSYSSTSVSTTEATVLSLALGPLLNGVTYDLFGYGMAQAGAGAGFLDIGLRLRAGDPTVFGMRIGTVGGERPVAASDWEAGVVGTGASETVALRAVTTTGTGNIVAAHLWAIALPRR